MYNLKGKENKQFINFTYNNNADSDDHHQKV